LERQILVELKAVTSEWNPWVCHLNPFEFF